MNKEESIYVLKIGKMYLKSIYVRDTAPVTYYVHELDFCIDTEYLYDSVKFKTYKEADYTRDILKDILQLDINLIEIVKIEGDKDENIN